MKSAEMGNPAVNQDQPNDTGSTRIERTLRVDEARERDVGRAIIRLDNNTMNALNIQTGDIVELEGKKVTAGIAWPAYPKDQDLGIVRIDALLRKNAKSDLKETVRVRKAHDAGAELVELAPLSEIMTDAKFESFVKRKILHLPLAQDDEISISIGISRKIPFQVVTLRPQGICKVKNSTVIQIKGLQGEGIHGEFSPDLTLMEIERATLTVVNKILLKLTNPTQKAIRLDNEEEGAAATQKIVRILEILLEIGSSPKTTEDGNSEYPTKYPDILFCKRMDGSYWLVRRPLEKTKD